MERRCLAVHACAFIDRAGGEAVMKTRISNDLRWRMRLEGSLTCWKGGRGCG